MVAPIHAKTKGQAKSRGAALIEGALTIPLLLLFLAGLVDIGALIVRYVSASRFAYEGARFAAQLPGLEENSVSCGVYTITPNATVHGQVCSRMEILMEASGFDYAFGSGILSTRTAASGGEASTVTVSVTLPFDAMLLKYLGSTTVTASVHAPYLLR